jgi:ubiquinone/menaquinone biosynthesis C-methylase UbiE
MSLWGQIFAACYDKCMSGPEKAVLRDHRKALLSGTWGRVVEIGGGTGANLPFYPAGVEEIVITEPYEPMAKRLERKLQGSSLPVKVVRAPAETLPLDDASFDFAVSTLVLCTVKDQAAALGEIQRVLKPDGRLLFIEHVRAEDARLAGWQDRLNWLQQRWGNGCNCNRATLLTIKGAGFSVDRLSQGEMKKVPPIVRPLIVGTATA